MRPTAAFDPRWLRALELTERLRAPSGAYDDGRGRDRLAAWKGSAGLADPALFAEFLRAEGATEAELQRALGAEPAGEPPPWALECEECFTEAAYAECEPGPLELIAPLFARYDRRLRDFLAASDPARIDRERTHEALVAQLEARIRALSEKTLALEAEVHRQATGGADFAEHLRAPAARARLLREYPVLARLVARACGLWLENSVRFLTRLARDFELLELGAPLVGIEGGLGDSHNGGQSVMIAVFGDGAREVYKPRAVEVDARFQRLIGWLNWRGLEPALEAHRIFEREDEAGAYGWVEHLAPRDCGAREELEAFYTRQGAWLAIFHAIGGNDLHFENLIAVGEHPHVIDLEMLFNPRLQELRGSGADGLAQARFDDCVHGTGLLPAPYRKGEQLIDNSGLGAGPDRGVLHYPYEIACRPRLRGAYADPSEFAPRVVEGFARTCRFLRERREAFAAELRGFEAARCRMIARPTGTYAKLLQESHHPALLRDALDRDLFFTQLWWEGRARTRLRPLIPSERRQLALGDVPYFTATPGARDLLGGDGAVLRDALERTGFEVSDARLARMSEDELAFQGWITRAALACRGGTPVSPARLRAKTPAAIADWLAATACEDDESASWLTLDIDRGAGNLASGEAIHRPQVIGSDLYSGIAGVILFLARAGRRELAEKALRTLEARRPRLELPVGLHCGWAGLIHLYVTLARVWAREDLLDRASALVPEIAARLGQDRVHDLIGGAAGAIPPLMALDRARPDPAARALALRAGERLLALDLPRALAMPRGFAHGMAGVAWAFSELAALDARFGAAALETIRREDTLLAERWTDLPGQERNPQFAWCHGAPGIALGRLLVHRNLGAPEARASAERALEAFAASPPVGNHSLCHGDAGNLAPLALAAELDPRWAAEHERRREALETASEWITALPGGIEAPGLMKGLTGVGYALVAPAFW